MDFSFRAHVTTGTFYMLIALALHLLSERELGWFGEFRSCFVFHFVSGRGTNVAVVYASDSINREAEEDQYRHELQYKGWFLDIFLPICSATGGWVLCFRRGVNFPGGGIRVCRR